MPCLHFFISRYASFRPDSHVIVVLGVSSLACHSTVSRWLALVQTFLSLLLYFPCLGLGLFHVYLRYNGLSTYQFLQLRAIKRAMAYSSSK